MAWYGRDYYGRDDYGTAPSRGWGGEFTRGHGRGWIAREHPAYGPRDHRGGRYDPYDRDFGDQVREGWNDLKRGVRRAFGADDYDRGYRTGRGGYGRYGERGGYRAHPRGYDRGWF